MMSLLSGRINIAWDNSEENMKHDTQEIILNLLRSKYDNVCVHGLGIISIV